MGQSFEAPGGLPPVHVVDDDEEMRHALKLLLEGLSYTVHLYEDALEFLELASDPIGVLLLDLRLRGMGGLVLQKRLEQYKDLQIIFMSGVGEVPDAVAALKAGAYDFLIKPFRHQVILDSVAGAMMKVLEVHRHKASLHATRQSFNSLTETEQEVARLVASGLRNKEIAYMTNKTENTVKVHRSRIMQKMGVSSAYALMLRFQLLGFNIEGGAGMA